MEAHPQQHPMSDWQAVLRRAQAAVAATPAGLEGLRTQLAATDAAATGCIAFSSLQVSLCCLGHCTLCAQYVFPIYGDIPLTGPLVFSQCWLVRWRQSHRLLNVSFGSATLACRLPAHEALLRRCEDTLLHVVLLQRSSLLLRSTHVMCGLLLLWFVLPRPACALRGQLRQ